MSRGINLLFTACCVTLSAVGAYAAGQSDVQSWNRAKTLFESGRWIDARHELLQYRSTLASSDVIERQKTDYYLSMCSVELGSQDAAATLSSFLDRSDNAIFNNDVEFALASLYCKQGEYDAAARQFLNVNYKSLNRLNREKYDIRMGYITFMGGQYDEAYKYLGKLTPKSEYYDHALYYKSYIDYVRGDYAKAKRGFQDLTHSAAYARLAPYYLLQIEFNQGNHKYVVDNGDALIATAAVQQRQELNRVMSESWFHLDDYNRAMKYLADYRASGGEMGRNENYIMGFSLYRTARYSEAGEYLRNACGADDALTQNASYHLADCYLRSGDKRQAMQSFAMASSDKFDQRIAEDALLNYGKLQYELGGDLFNETINVLQRYIAKYPKSKHINDVRALLIAAYYNSHNYDAAYEAIKSFAAPDADMLSALQKIAYFRGLQQFATDRIVDAKESFDESIRINISPKYTSLATFWRGEIAFSEQRYADALADYNLYLRRAPKSEPEYAKALYNIGYCYFQTGRMDDARFQFAKFTELYPTADSYRADAFNRIGDANYSQRQFAYAIANYEKAAALKSIEQYYADYQRAIALGITGDKAAKATLLKSIISADRGDYVDDATYELGREYIAAEDYSGGAGQLEQFVGKYPHSPLYMQALSDLGLAYLNLGDKTRSLKYYEKVVSSAPQSAEAKDALQGIRDIYISNGDAEAYFAYAAKVGAEGDLNSIARDSLSFASARKIYMSGNTSSAEKSLRSYLKSYPKGYYTADALYYLTDCYLKSDNTDAAIDALSELSKSGNSQYATDALQRLSRMTYSKGLYAESADAYRRLYAVAHTEKERAEAVTGYVRATIESKDAEAILKMSDEVPTLADVSESAHRESQFAKAKILLARNLNADALHIFKSLSADVSTVEGAEAKYYVIENEFKLGHLDEAEKMIYAFSDKNSAQAYWLAKAFILLGDIYVARADTFQARATYQSVADGYSPADDGIVTEAKERIEKLK